MSVLWTPVATGVPHAQALEIQQRLEAAGIAFLPAEATSWIGKLRAFIENAPDLSLFVDKGDVDKARAAIQGIIDPSVNEQTIDGYVATLGNDQLKQLIASPGWPDLVLDPAKRLLRDRTRLPAPTPQSAPRLPLLMGLAAVCIGPVGSWISRQVLQQAQPWEDKLVPLYDEATQSRTRKLVTIGQVVFALWFIGFFILKCVR